MDLPHRDQAVVPLQKVSGYLLNEDHPEGRGKATFFRRLGFRFDEPHVLRLALLRLAQDLKVTESSVHYGLKYVGVGMLDCPNGRRVRVQTVWMLRGGQPPPYLVTAYPA